MKQYLGIGIAVGVLAGLWTQVSVELHLVTWVAFIAWACFFAAGGGRVGFLKGSAANLSGVFWGWVITLVIERATFDGALALSVTVIGFILCVQAAAAPLSFIPGAFAGTAVFFGTAFDVRGTVIAVVAGACLGWLSEYVGTRIQSAVDSHSPAVGAEQSPPAAGSHA